MVLAEETPESVTFRFNGTRWALLTLIPGMGLVVLACILYVSTHASHFLLAALGLFGLLLLYSSLYSKTANQWLTANGNSKTIRFYKKNLYGLVEWEKSAGDFEGIIVGRHLRATNWHIAVRCRDGYDLFVGENEFGAFTREKALSVANKISSRTGLTIDAQDERS